MPKFRVIGEWYPPAEPIPFDEIVQAVSAKEAEKAAYKLFPDSDFLDFFEVSPVSVASQLMASEEPQEETEDELLDEAMAAFDIQSDEESTPNDN